jgi:centromeric protein E
MMGTQADPGFIVRAIRHLFQLIEESPDKQFLLRMSYLEIYNELVIDLLAQVSED